MRSLLKPPEFFQDPAAQQQKSNLRDGRGTPSRASLQAPVARAAAPAARSMSPPRWSQAPQPTPGVGTAWTWPETGTLNRGTTYTPATPWAPSIHSYMCFFTIRYTLFIFVVVFIGGLGRWLLLKNFQAKRLKRLPSIIFGFLA